jgi:hypothetical protein
MIILYHDAEFSKVESNDVFLYHVFYFGFK